MPPIPIVRAESNCDTVGDACGLPYHGAVPVPPTLRSFDLNLLILFDALYRERKLATAAAAVGLSQPGASQALSRMRETFDDPLFVRRGTGMDPTAHAHTLAPMVREALASIERGLTALRSFDPMQSEREFRVGLAELGEAVILPDIVSRLSKIAPNVRLISVRGSRNELQSAAVKRDVDLALDFEPPTEASLQHEMISEEELVVIARLDHPRIRGSVSVEQFFAERHVAVDLEPAARRRVASVLSAPVSVMRTLCTCAHYSSVPGVVMETDGLATVPRALVSMPLYSGRVQVLEPPFPLFKIPVYVYWSRGLETDAGHSWLRSHLVKRFWVDRE